MASGIQARGGIGIINENTGFTKASARRLAPMARPRGTPVATATTKPMRTSCALCRMCPCSCASAYPVSAIWRSASQTSLGAGKRVGGMTWVAVSAHHAASTATTVPAAMRWSVFFIGEGFQLRVRVHQLQVLVGDEALGRRRLGEGAVRLHEL